MSDINIVLENRDDIHVAVEEKDINVEVPAGKDGRSLRPRGEWSASAAYAYLDLVSYEGSSYVATKAVPAGTLPTDTSYWMLSAEKGEPGGAVWGNITGDLSEQTDLQTALDAKADVIISSASGSIASFSDGSASPVTALSVGIEPVQDLHGYDNPWPAGGGKNLLKPPSSGATIKDVTFTVNSDGTITANGGTSTGDADFYFVGAQGVYESANIPTGNYIVSGNSGAANVTTIHIVKKTGSEVICTQNADIPVSVSLDENEQYRIFIRVHNGKTVTNQKYYPMIRLASVTDATFAPYSNICPISGHTSATVTRTGKNLVNINGRTISSQTTILPTTKFYAGTYILSADVKNDSSIRGNIRVAKVGTSLILAEIAVLSGDNTRKSASFTLSEDMEIYILCNGASVGYQFSIDNIQLELGSVPSPYEPYQGQQVTIDLDGTRYGGTLDVMTGEMVVDRVGYDMGSLNWTHVSPSGSVVYDYFKINISGITPNVQKTICSMYPCVSASVVATSGYDKRIAIGGSTIFVADSSYTDANIFKSAVNGQYVVCVLATPITVQLTPEQLSTLIGTNNIWADTGDVAVEYRADTKLYIDGVASVTAKVTRQMIADSATADGKAPKSLATGDLIIVGDELRKATANIGNGSAITASNSTTATLADVIKALQ